VFDGCIAIAMPMMSAAPAAVAGSEWIGCRSFRATFSPPSHPEKRLIG
jgi:hypothetical protein